MTRLTVLLVSFLVVFTGCRGETPKPTVSHRKPPIIVVSIDTLRADHLPAFGYDKVETPAIDAIRRDGILFRNAWSHVPLTLPSHVSILTGLLPYEHGVRDNLGYSFDPSRHPTMPTALHQAGYATGASVSAYVLRGSTGLAAAFDWYDDAISERIGTPIGNLQRPAKAALATAETWIVKQNDRPFFLLLHLFEPHSPYEPPEPFRSRFSNPYDGEIATADAVLGDLVTFLKEHGIYDDALVIVLSDHGEGLGDHGETEHGVLLYREALHVPLIVKLPRSERAGSTVDNDVQLIDVAPTVAAVAGVKMAATPHASSLLSLPDKPVPVYSETLYPRLHFGWSELRSIVDGRHHFIEAPRLELYDMAADPRETKNIAEDQRRDLSRLRQVLAVYPRVDANPASIDPEEAKKLAALGYVGSGGSEAGAGANPRDRIEEIEALKEGLSLESEATPEEMIRFYKAVLAKNPDSIDTRGQLAAALDKAGRFTEAEEQYKEALRRRPYAFHGIAISLAELQLKMGKLDEAETHARLALDRVPAQARRLLARVAEARHDFDEAEKVLGDPAEDPSLRAYVDLAQIRANQKRIPEAIAVLEDARSKSLESGIDVELLRYALGDLYFLSRRPEEAELEFREEIRAFPRNIYAWARLAMTLDVLGKKDELPFLFSEMVRLNPTPQARALATETQRRIEAHKR